jgi:PAS domain S-box-containing protein
VCLHTGEPPARANVLLVDDRPANLLALEAVLDNLGHNLVKTTSGAEALELLLDRDFAVVLLDVQMDGLDGFETARQLRARERSRHTPIIFLTAHDDDRLSAEQAYHLGAVDYLVKPLVPVILRAKVTGFIELFQKTEQVRRQAERLRQMERLEFERKLAAENARFRALTEHSSDAVVLVAPDGTVLYTSPSTRGILGYEPGEFVGRNGLELVHPDDQERISRRLAELVQAPGTSVTVETQARHKDGSWRWVECVGTNLLAEPAVGAVVVNFRDITERQRALAALRDNEERLRTLSDNLPRGAIYQAIQAPDGRTRVTYVSAGVERLFGVAPEEVQKDPEILYRTIHEEDAPRMRAAEAVALRTLTPFECEFRQWTRAGDFVWVYCRSAPRRLPTGEAIWDGVILDVTDRKRIEEALRQSEQRFARFMQHLPGLAWIKDAQGRYVYANDAAEAVFRTPRAQLYGKADEELFPAEVAAQFRANDRRALASGTGVQVIETLEHADGVRHHSIVSKFPIPGLDPTAVMVGGMAIDITDRIEMEARLQTADRRKDEFLAMLAHELRNPLAPICNAVQLMRVLGSEDANVQRARDMIDRQVNHLARLVDDLLDVSRITRGKITLQKEPLALAVVIARAVETSRPLIDARRHTLTVTLPPEPLRVEADMTRLAQVVSNLLNNAAKYTEEGGHIELHVERAGADAVVRVRDSGLGIPGDLLPHVFDLFTQGDRSLARSEGGLGIGLTLVKSLVEMHGGTVTAHSDGPGRGSEFVVRLPTLQALPEPSEPEGAARPALCRAERSRRVLVVDDNADAAESLAVLLRLDGHEVCTAHDGAAALETARGFRPEVVVLDIGLPRMDGYQVARRLRAEVGLTEALVVALTGYGQEEDRRRAEQAGFDAHLVKPADPEVLQRLLARTR